jgi:hypothetical protein
LVTSTGWKYLRVRVEERKDHFVVFASAKGPVQVDMAELPAGLAGLAIEAGGRGMLDLAVV